MPTIIPARWKPQWTSAGPLRPGFLCSLQQGLCNSLASRIVECHGWLLHSRHATLPLKLHYCTFCSAPEHLLLALPWYLKTQAVPAIALLVAWTENARV